MSMPFEFDLRIRAGKKITRVQRLPSAIVLGLLAISLLLLAIPVSASGGEPNASPSTETSIAPCATGSDALIRFHRAKPVDDPANGAWSLAEAEFYAAKYGSDGLAGTALCEALARFHRAKPVDDPVNGAWSFAEAEFYLTTYGADLAACRSWPEALAQFHGAKPVDDPANGAWSHAEAEFYVAKYGSDGAVIVTLEDNARAFSCDTEPYSVGPES